MDHTPVLLRNVNADHHHWVGLQLIGGAQESSRCDRGYESYLTAGGIEAARRCDERWKLRIDQNDFVRTSGLARMLRVDKVEIGSGLTESARRSHCRASIAITRSKRIRGLCQASHDGIAAAAARPARPRQRIRPEPAGRR